MGNKLVAEGVCSVEDFHLDYPSCGCARALIDLGDGILSKCKAPAQMREGMHNRWESPYHEMCGEGLPFFELARAKVTAAGEPAWANVAFAALAGGIAGVLAVVAFAKFFFLATNPRQLPLLV